MKKTILNIIFLYFLIFSCVINVNAECSYKERTELLNEAKKVEVFFEPAEKVEIITAENPNTGEISEIKKNVLYLKLNVTNLSKDLFVKIVNTIDKTDFVVNYGLLKNGVYTTEIYNIEDVVKYKVEFYSSVNSCYGKEVYSKTINKPKFNSISQYSVCINDFVSESEYCRRFIYKNFSMSESEVIDYLNKQISIENERYLQEQEKNKFNLLRFMKDYWYICTGVTFLGVAIVVIIFVIKKRGELK